ncbi:MAG: tetratricopeptide repeat protein [Candidatus Thermoplasmatota archaeon]|nr:tetratricopeptide repeat protein [Candidatus Thermoplasmatota archaeon]
MGSAKRKRMARKKMGGSHTSKNVPMENIDRRVMEKSTWVMHKFMDREKFETAGDANEFIEKIYNSEKLDSYVPESPEDRAQMMAYDACQKTGNARKEMALKAIDISENCADAYVILAELEKNPQTKIDLYRKASAAARKTLGEKAFTEYRGDFWKIIGTRPYMRAQEGLALSLWNSGRMDEAKNIYEELLELNPDDNQGVRYSLLLIYMIEGNADKAEELLNTYDEDGADWDYNRSLLLFRKSGVTIESKTALRKAFSSNIYVPAMLVGAIDIPGRSNYITPGQPDEASSYVRSCGALWLDNEEAIKWMIEEFEQYLTHKGKVD